MTKKTASATAVATHADGNGKPGKKTKLAKVGSFSDLAIAKSANARLADLKLSIPKTKEATSVKAQFEEMRKIAEQAPEVEEYVTHLMQFTTDVDDLVDSLGSDVFEQDYTYIDDDGSEATVKTGDRYREFLSKIEELRAWPLLPIRKAANKAFIIFNLSRTLAYDKYMQVVQDLEKCGCLVPDPEGLIPVWSRNYRLSSDEKFGKLGKEEEEHVSRAVANQVGRLSSELKRTSEEGAKNLESKATIAIDKITDDDANGLVYVYAPAEFVPAKGDRKPYKLSPVYLLVAITRGDQIRVVDAVGYKRDEMLRVKDKKLFLKAKSLKSDTPPSFKFLTETLEFSDEDASDIIRLWNWVKRGIRWNEEAKAKKRAESLRAQRITEAQESEARTRFEKDEALTKALNEAEPIKNAFKQRATMTADQFFGNEKLPGTAYVEFGSDWTTKSQTVVVAIGLLFFLVERKQEATGVSIRIADVPTHLENFFSNCRGTYLLQNNNFVDLPQPFKAVMQATWRQEMRKVANV